MHLSFILLLVFYIGCLWALISLLLENREPAETFAWIFIIIIFPIFGFFIYMMFGRNWKNSYDHKRRLPQFEAKNLVNLFKPLTDLQDQAIQQLKKNSSVYQDDLMTLLYRNSRALLTTNNKVKIFHDGKSKFESLFEDIKNAKQFIHLQYFIWRSEDTLGRKIKKLLIEKAKEGVEIRILYDFSGCLFLLKNKYIKELRKEKIEIYPFFNYLSNFKAHTLNYRNHRKIVVIDGNIGYTGGMNVGQEYIDGGKKYKSWRDTHLRLEGEAVGILQAVFAIDWYNTVEKEAIFDAKYFTAIPEKGDLKGDLPIQLPTSGFDSTWYSILQLYFTLITAAQKNIYIVSPYFIPDDSLLMALKTASMRGVKVTVLMMGVPDNLIPYWAAFSYFDELLRAGVKIYQYKAGFMHAKIVSIDGKISTIGTANFDIRSLKLNYEINTVFYQEKLTQGIDAQIKRDLEQSKEILLSDIKDASVFVRLRSSILRLMAGIL